MGNNCVFWHWASCLCSLHSNSLRGFYDLSVTLFLSLIYRFHLMFSILACPHIFLFARLLQMVLVVRVRLFLCKAFTCCMLGSVSTLMCHSNEPLLHISGHFTVTGCSSYTPHPPIHTFAPTAILPGHLAVLPEMTMTSLKCTLVCACVCLLFWGRRHASHASNGKRHPSCSVWMPCVMLISLYA